jgi:Negative regulator of sigma F
MSTANSPSGTVTSAPGDTNLLLMAPGALGATVPQRRGADLDQWMVRCQQADPEAPPGRGAHSEFPVAARRGAILYPAMTGAAAGLIAGLVGTSILEIHCPNLNGWHTMVWHLGVAVVCSIADLGLGLKSKMRSRQRT